MQKLTAAERRTLTLIRRFIRQNGYPPSIRDLADEEGIGPPAMLDRLRSLEDKKRIQRDKKIPRGIRVLRAA